MVSILFLGLFMAVSAAFELGSVSRWGSPSRSLQTAS
jgi:hypothetical protein